ncbi:hypothetical protein HDU67_005390, partial [Dinochytrium kinnereticum]
MYPDAPRIPSNSDHSPTPTSRSDKSNVDPVYRSLEDDVAYGLAMEGCAQRGEGFMEVLLPAVTEPVNILRRKNGADGEGEGPGGDLASDESVSEGSVSGAKRRRREGGSRTPVSVHGEATPMSVVEEVSHIGENTGTFMAISEGEDTDVVVKERVKQDKLQHSTDMETPETDQRIPSVPSVIQSSSQKSSETVSTITSPEICKPETTPPTVNNSPPSFVTPTVSPTASLPFTPPASIAVAAEPPVPPTSIVSSDPMPSPALIPIPVDTEKCVAMDVDVSSTPSSPLALQAPVCQVPRLARIKVTWNRAQTVWFRVRERKALLEARTGIEKALRIEGER